MVEANFSKDIVDCSKVKVVDTNFSKFMEEEATAARTWPTAARGR